MKKSLHLTLAFIFLFSLIDNLSAAPFDTGMITLTQPNDVTFTGRIWGDEFIWWSETEDGYRFIETFDGWFYYTTLDQNGEYAPTNYKVGIDSPPASSYQLERSQARLNEINEQLEEFNEQVELNKLWYAQKQAEADAHDEPVTLKVGIILIEFTDTTHYTTGPEGNRPNGYLTADFDSMMFSNNYWIAPPNNNIHPEREEIFGSFRDYWDQISLGKLKIKGRVANPDNNQDGVPDWLMADSSKGYYASIDSHYTLVNEAIRKALEDSLIDTTNTSAQNYFDKLVIVYADEARNLGALRVKGGQGLGSNWIFLAERSTRKLYYGDQPSFTHIGIYAHEFGHNLGFHDEYYQYNPSSSYQTDGFPTDILNFCLMARGIYNGPLEKGECPATLSSYYRIDKSWVTPPTVLPADTNNFVVQYDYANPKFYRINPVDATNGEHFIFENKKRTGFDLYIPGNPADSINQPGRLIVWHHDVDFSLFDDDPDRITITPADDSLSEYSMITDFFPKQFNPNSQDLSDITNPAANLGGRFSNGKDNSRPAHFALNGIQKLVNGNTLINEIRLNLIMAPDPISISKDYYVGWDLVSVPLNSFNYIPNTVFPTAQYIYKYDGGYQTVNVLENGPGYWAKFIQPSQTVDFYGLPVSSISIPVNAGWNIIGTISYPVPVPSIYSNPPGIILLKYKYIQGIGNVSLTPRDSLKAGFGYWIKTSTAGSIILDIISTPDPIEEIAFDTMDKFIVTDSDGNSQTLYVSNIDIDTAVVNKDFELPPFFPDLPFDSRFEFGDLVKKVSADSGQIELNILVETNSFPVNLSWEINPENGINYSFIRDSTIGKVSSILAESGTTSFPKLDNNRIQLLATVNKTKTTDNLPNEFVIEQNYPNPFNPSTTIKFALPKETQVNLSVFNILGEKVKELKNEVMKPGYYEVNFDASMLASGIYFYRIQAGGHSTSSGQRFVQTKKMILLK